MSDHQPGLSFKPHLSNAPHYRGETAILKTLPAAGDPAEVIRLDSNESLLPPSAQAVAAIQAEAAGLNRYPLLMGDGPLRTALAESLGQAVSPAHLVTGNGGCDVLALIASAFLSPGDEVIICRPTFPVYDLTARRQGATVTYVDLDPTDFSYQVEAILAAITAHTRLLYLCNPNNPTGTLLTAEQMDRLIQGLPSHVLTISDEVYHHFVTSPDFPNTLDYVRQGKNVVVLHSFSKVFGLAGLRLGYGIARPEIADYLARARQPYHLSQLSMAGAMAALQDQAHIEETIALTIAGRNWLYETLQGLKLPVWPSQANFILFKPPLAPEIIVRHLAGQGVMIRGLAGFYLPDYLRVTVGLPPENERFRAALAAALLE
jgi:histidinol-phosphate aminotransferase